MPFYHPIFRNSGGPRGRLGGYSPCQNMLNPLSEVENPFSLRLLAFLLP